jgi:hypothetical protein
MQDGPDYADCCPDCGEPLARRRGVVPLTATRYCQSCNWCEVADRDRQANAKEDWYVRNVRNRPDNVYVDDYDDDVYE